MILCIYIYTLQRNGNFTNLFRTYFIYIYIENSTTPRSTDDAMRFDILPECAIYIQLKLKRVTDGGDHDVAICEVVGTGIWNDSEQSVLWLKDTEKNAVNQFSALDPTSALYSGQLRSQGII